MSKRKPAAAPTMNQIEEARFWLVTLARLFACEKGLTSYPTREDELVQMFWEKVKPFIEEDGPLFNLKEIQDRDLLRNFDDGIYFLQRSKIPFDEEGEPVFDDPAEGALLELLIEVTGWHRGSLEDLGGLPSWFPPFVDYMAWIRDSKSFQFDENFDARGRILAVWSALDPSPREDPPFNLSSPLLSSPLLSSPLLVSDFLRGLLASLKGGRQAPSGSLREPNGHANRCPETRARIFDRCT